MKVGLLTFPNSISYGCVLQMYALYHTVQSMGHEAEVINYQNLYMKQEQHLSGEKKARAVVRKLLHWRLYKNFSKFEKEKLRCVPTQPFSNKEQLRKLGKEYSAVICGSDQVWNPDITNYDLSYFLDFCEENTRRIAYAPSFGVERLSREFAVAVGAELNKFSSVSVREEVGQTLVNQITGLDAPIVVDPTMLLCAEDWYSVERPHPAGSGEYILYYTVRNSDVLMERCCELSKKTGLKIVVIGGNFINRMKKRNPIIDYAVDVSPAEWLYLMHHARYVVTNSFHGTAFSIIFHKDFYLELSSATNSRLKHIATMMGLESRIIKDEMADPAQACDYSIAEKRLSMIRDESLKYLEDALCVGEYNG